MLATLLHLLGQFTGERGGIDHTVVNCGIAAIFYAFLINLSVRKYRDEGNPRPRSRRRLPASLRACASCWSTTS